MLTDSELACLVMTQIERLAQITDEPGRLTRLFGSPAMRRANELVAGWMQEAGLTTEQDAIGNLIGHYPADRPGAKVFLMGSHLDTVRDAGKFDGPLGVLIALACVRRLHETRTCLPFEIKVAGFADEEGVRFQSSYLGSRVMAGTFDEAELKRIDASGISMREAILESGGDPAALYGAHLDPVELLGYAEVHIEQGPVLEARALPVGVVGAIAGQARIEVAFTGRAGHAGTTPMSQRRDALAAAAHFMAGAELFGRNTSGMVVTVGEITVHPGASNVIPGRARFSLDLRHQEDAARQTAVEALHALALQLARDRGLGLDWQEVSANRAVPCSARFSGLLKAAVRRHVPEVMELPSGAGHDAVALSAITPVAMLFIRCKDGLSHHPAESVETEDVAVAIAVMHDFLRLLAKEYAGD